MPILWRTRRCRRCLREQPEQAPCGDRVGEVHLLQQRRGGGGLLLNEPDRRPRRLWAREMHLLRKWRGSRRLVFAEPEPGTCSERLSQPPPSHSTFAPFTQAGRCHDRSRPPVYQSDCTLGCGRRRDLVRSCIGKHGIQGCADPGCRWRICGRGRCPSPCGNGCRQPRDRATSGLRRNNIDRRHLDAADGGRRAVSAKWGRRCYRPTTGRMTHGV